MIHAPPSFADHVGKEHYDAMSLSPGGGRARADVGACSRWQLSSLPVETLCFSLQLTQVLFCHQCFASSLALCTRRSLCLTHMCWIGSSSPAPSPFPSGNAQCWKTHILYLGSQDRCIQIVNQASMHNRMVRQHVHYWLFFRGPQ